MPIIPHDASAHEPLHVSISNALAREILDGLWVPGKSKKLEDIQQQFDISRTVAREATRLLASLGCVHFQRGVGVIACDPAEWDDMSVRVITWKLHSKYRKDELRVLTELRLAVEPVAAAGCAARGSVTERASIGAIGLDMVKAAHEDKLQHFHLLDIQFHTLILKHSGNPLFADLSVIIETVLRGRVEINLFPVKPVNEALNWHTQVAHAIIAGDDVAASQAMRLIVGEVNTTLGLSAL